MKNFFNHRQYSAFNFRRWHSLRLASLKLVAILCLSFVSLCLTPSRVSHAQRLSWPLKVSNVSARTSENKTLVSIAADGSLSQAQTWQDNEGFHVVLPNTVAVDSIKVPRAMRLRRLGTSLEVLVQTQSGAKVSMHTGDDGLSLVIDSKLVPRSLVSDASVQAASIEEQQLFENLKYQTPQKVESGDADSSLPNFSSTVEDLTSSSRPAVQQQTPINSSGAHTSLGTNQQGSNEIVPQQDGTTAPDSDAVHIKIQPEDDGFVASIFSGTSVLVIVALGLLGLLVSRKLRSRQVAAEIGGQAFPAEDIRQALETSDARNDQADRFAGNGHQSLAKIGNSIVTSGSSRAIVPVTGPNALYGAYRIDQEVGKLLVGQAHRLDVLSSRAVDDRRAIETSLMKGVNALELDESARRKAREALEEYGFVARLCASLLLAPDAFERTSAARALGEIKSPAALPFLLEGLYDAETIVRNQAVVSIGELKIPSAIGALLDMASKHPDVPSALLSRTLSACSVEGLDFFDAAVPEPGLLGSGDIGRSIIEEMTQLEPASSVEDLPEGSDDPALAQVLSCLESDSVQERAESVKILVQFPVQSAVGALALVARHDPEPNIRAQALSSLASINHESVFPAVLIGLADESREVRAAAARSLNRLSFDRADAYVRVIETCDEETMQDIARASIQAGIVSQNIDRLTNSDHRQAYETFALICLLAKAKMNEPILDAISNHPDMDVRLKAVHLLAATGQPATFEQLRQLAVQDGMREEVRTALLEAMYKLEQAKAKEEETLEPFVVHGEQESEAEGCLNVETTVELEPEAEIQREVDEIEL